MVNWSYYSDNYFHTAMYAQKFSLNLVIYRSQKLEGVLSNIWETLYCN